MDLPPLFKIRFFRALIIVGYEALPIFGSSKLSALESYTTLSNVNLSNGVGLLNYKQPEILP